MYNNMKLFTLLWREMSYHFSKIHCN